MKTILESHKIAKEVSEVAVPFHVWRLIGNAQKSVFINGEQLCLGEDYGTLEECRNAVAWYVEQLGGKVKWNKE